MLSSWSRSTSASPTRRCRRDGSRPRDPRLAADRSRRGRGDRAARLPDAVVAVDVRVRAGEAHLDLPRGVRGPGPDRLRDQLALRRRVARDERGRRPGSPAPRRRLPAARATLRADAGRRAAGLHPRGPRHERGSDPPLRTARLRGARDQARLLHRQSGRRPDHVARRPRTVILGLETSCDETAAALVTDEGEILSSVVASQAELHARFGGVVPEVASRRHLELVTPVIREALTAGNATLAEVDRVAVTQGPGLVGARR